MRSNDTLHNVQHLYLHTQQNYKEKGARSASVHNNTQLNASSVEDRHEGRRRRRDEGRRRKPELSTRITAVKLK